MTDAPRGGAPLGASAEISRRQSPRHNFPSCRSGKFVGTSLVYLGGDVRGSIGLTPGGGGLIGLTPCSGYCREAEGSAGTTSGGTSGFTPCSGGGTSCGESQKGTKPQFPDCSQCHTQRQAAFAVVVVRSDRERIASLINTSGVASHGDRAMPPRQ